MAQIAILVMSILGLCNMASLKTVCIVVFVCEIINILVDLYNAHNS